MKIIKDRGVLDEWVDDCRRNGERIGFVPTMGALHDGHLSLLAAARQDCSRTIVSIFVNPTQFGPNEDFSRYPRTFDKDRELLAEAGCDAVFFPDVDTIYPPGAESFVDVGPLGSQLCGVSRPGHFRGVATVVTILLNLVRPHGAYFGRKDYQQFTIIRRMVRDLAMPVQVVGVETVREEDGLAMSSRNRYLNPDERQKAAAIHGALRRAAELYRSGERSCARMEAAALKRLQESGIHRIEYVEIRDSASLVRVDFLTQELPVMLIAVRVGETRLIDNMLLSQ